MCIPDDMPLRLVLCPGISEAELIAQLQHWRGLPILPPGNEVQIIELHPPRFEPELEDTP